MARNPCIGDLLIGLEADDNLRARLGMQLLGGAEDDGSR
jgi:hypothetical protein